MSNPDPLVAGFTAAWPQYAWATGVHAQGAFHRVCVVAPDVVGRSTLGTVAEDDAHRETANLRALNPDVFPVAVPQALADPVAMGESWLALSSWVPGKGASDLQAMSPERHRTYSVLLEAFRECAIPREVLPEPRAWCGGAQFETIVREELAPRLQRGERATANDAVSAMLDAETYASAGFCHGDFGPHNILWSGQEARSLIDFDHACWGDPAIDVAPLIGFHTAAAIRGLCDVDTLERAMTHRATLSLQVAAAAHIRGLTSLRDHMLGSFTRRAQDGTLRDPAGMK